MSSERQSKTPDWKQSLLRWEQSGGHTEAKEDLLWEKLQEKLQPGRKKRPIVLWGRAAAILVLLAVSLFFLLRKNGSPEKAEVAKASPPETPSLQKEKPAIVVKESGPPATVAIKQEAAPAIAREKKEKQHVAMQDEKVQKISIDPVQPVIVAVPEPILTTVEKKVNDTPVVAKAIVPKRKLRVVHINELNAPPPPTYASLKEELRQTMEPEPENETILPAPSIWPGRNKPKPSTISLGN